jgi:NAD(P)-dependent dehydrogenase (short-subunit alcohol dehydrogenase family)
MEEVMDKELDGRAIVVTGAGGGIGRAASLSFAAAGAKVVVSDRDEKGGEETVEQIVSQGPTKIASLAW